MNPTRSCPLCGADAQHQYAPDRDTHTLDCAVCGYYKARGDLAQFDPLTAQERHYIAAQNRNLNRYNCHCRYFDGARNYLRDHATAERVASAYGLAEAAIEASGGCEGKTFIAATGDRRYTMRLYPDDHARIRSELHWLAALRDAGIGALDPVPTPAGRPFLKIDAPDNPERVYAVLYHWIEGVPFQLLTEEQTPSLIDRLGEYVARIHECGYRFAPPEWFVAPNGDIDAIRRNIAAADDDETRSLGGRLLSLLDTFSEGDYGIIHNDLTGLNILCHDGGFSAIDWAGFRRGYFASDLSQLFIDGLAEAQYAPFIDGYRRIRPLDNAFIDHIELFKKAQTLKLLQ